MSTKYDDYFEKLLKSSATFLHRWRGADALLRELTVSHRTLHVLLTRPDQAGNLLLSCIDPVRIAGSIQWNNSDLSVSRVRISEDDEGFLLRDEKAGVEIVCGGLEVREHVKL